MNDAAYVDCDCPCCSLLRECIEETLYVFESSDGYVEVEQALDYLGATMAAQRQHDKGAIMSTCPGITEEQLATTNGCGSSFWLARIFRIPKWLSHDLYCKCGCHDLGYQDKTQISWEHKRRKDVALVDGIYDSAYMGPAWQCGIKVVVAEVVWWCLNTWISKLCYLAAKIGE